MNGGRCFGRAGVVAGGRGSGGGFRNPCLTMHQPWASLLVHGIKRIEGRSWPAPIRGRLWIHAAGKVPDADTIKAMEEFYREIYAVNGITNLEFPTSYPVSCLLGCVEIAGCVNCEELSSWTEVPESVRLEGLTKFCWLCEEPQKITSPFEMRGDRNIYDLERKLSPWNFELAFRSLLPVKSPLPVKFPLPNHQDIFSLRPGSLALFSSISEMPTEHMSSRLTTAIAGARSAALQFSKKDQNQSTAKIQVNLTEKNNLVESSKMDWSNRMANKDTERQSYSLHATYNSNKWQTSSSKEKYSLGNNPCMGTPTGSSLHNQEINRSLPIAHSKLFAAALHDIKMISPAISR